MFHHAESSAFTQVSASQGSNGIPDVPGRPRSVPIRAACELVLEDWFGSSTCGVAQRRGRALRHGTSRCGPTGSAPRRESAAGHGEPRRAAIRTASASGAGCAPGGPGARTVVGPEPAYSEQFAAMFEEGGEDRNAWPCSCASACSPTTKSTGWRRACSRTVGDPWPGNRLPASLVVATLGWRGLPLH